MSVITDVRCVLTQETLDTFCNMFHIPEEVHPVLPDQGDKMHERPAGKTGLYTRFFDFANFRMAKVFHFEILCRVNGIVPTVGLFQCFYVNSKKSGWMSFSKRSDNVVVCYTKPLDSLKNWNNHFFYVDDFACPASFPWHTAKHMIRDHVPAEADFSAQEYATLVAHPSPLRNFSEPFLCLAGLSRHYTLDEETYPWFVHKNEEDMDLFAFIHTLDPTKIRVVEKEREVDEPQLLDATVGRTVPLLLVAPDRADSELEANVERLFNEGGSGGPLAIKTCGEDKICGCRCRELPILLKNRGRIMEPQVGLSLVREDEGHTDSVAEPNLRTIGAPSSIHVMKTATTVTSMIDSTLVAKEKTDKPSLFSAGGTDPNTSVFSDLTSSDFLVGGICTVINPESDLQKTYVPQWTVSNRSRLDDGRVCREMVDEFAPPKFFASVREVEHDQLFTLSQSSY
nr:hypothetical protein [Tanacetum cinerariifolium]